jgi:hypothetical protein
MEETMRLAGIAFIAAIGILSGAQPSLAFGPGAGLEAHAGSQNIIQVDRRCGRHRHYIPHHRDRFGHWHGGRCVPNHR